MSSNINPENKQEDKLEEELLLIQNQNPILTIPNYYQDPHIMHHQEATDPFLPLPGGARFPAHFPWPTPYNPTPDPFLFPPPLPSNLFGRRGPQPPQHLQFSTYDVGPSSSSDPLRILSEALGQPGGGPFGLQMQAELNRMTAQEIMDAKALAASKSHSEAERRRRERINNHLAKLRSLLPSTTKTDKASLLAEVIQHVKELKRQTSVIAETSSVPTESDELTVDPAAEVDSDGRLVVRASLSCDDRTDLLPDLIKALKALRLRTLKAEITTLGGRVKNVLFITGDDSYSGEDGNEVSGEQWSVGSIQEALRAVMEKSGGGGRDESSSGNAKRQRTNSNVNIIS